MSGISLTASMRSNLLSLQNISGQVSSTQNKLATGNKVNSTIDNPSSYYTALSLNNRADDLNALLDSMGQAVSTIKAATTALESASEFLEQASAVATQALETFPIQNIVARVTNEEELLSAIDSGKQGLIVLDNDISLSVNQNIELKDGQSLVGAGYLEGKGNKTKLSFEFINEVKTGILCDGITTIANLDICYKTNTNGEQGILEGGQITLQTTNLLLDSASTTNNQLYGILNSDIIFNGANNISSTQVDYSTGIYNSNMLLKNDTILNFSNLTYPMGNCKDIYLSDRAKLNIKDCSFAVVYANLLRITDQASLNIDAGRGIWGTNVEILSSECTVNINTLQPEFEDGLWGAIGKLRMVQGSSIKTKAGEISANEDFYASNAQEITKSFTNKCSTNVSSTVSKDNEYKEIFTDFQGYMQNLYIAVFSSDYDSSQYQKILNQYDALIKDASYKGINLLQPDKLTVKFNEDNTASLNVQGKDMSSKTLGLTTLEWQSQGDINKSIEELTSAINSIRSYSSELGNNYNIITTRQDFTESLINVLTEGADKLTLADMNEESANMLALQTRQQLAINSLSLASQASQSILKLF